MVVIHKIDFLEKFRFTSNRFVRSENVRETNSRISGDLYPIEITNQLKNSPIQDFR